MSTDGWRSHDHRSVGAERVKLSSTPPHFVPFITRGTCTLSSREASLDGAIHRAAWSPACARMRPSVRRTATDSTSFSRAITSWYSRSSASGLPTSMSAAV